MHRQSLGPSGCRGVAAGAAEPIVSTGPLAVSLDEQQYGRGSAPAWTPRSPAAGEGLLGGAAVAGHHDALGLTPSWGIGRGRHGRVNIGWPAGRWTHPPVAAVERDGDLVVTAVQGSDAWRLTAYGFLHDSEHALLAPFPPDSAVEVVFTAAFAEQFDQAGIFVRVSAERWVKAGVEFADGTASLGAVVTDGRSDWSLAPVPGWAGRRVVVRVSRSGDALTIRAGVEGEELRLVRVVPFDPDLVAGAGPFVCAPTRAGLTVAFHAWRTTEPDASLH